MTDRRRSAPPERIADDAAPELRDASEIIRALFGAMIDAGIPQAAFAERIGLSDRAVEKWRAPGAFADGVRGPGLVHVIRGLHALGLELDIRPLGGGARGIPLWVRNNVAEIARDQLRRKETPAEWQDRHDRLVADARRKGIPTDGGEG